jgi:hypothetical protein
LKVKAIEPTDDQIARAAKYAKNIKTAAFKKQKEVAVRNNFYHEVLEGILGYEPYAAEAPYSVAYEHPVAGRSVDAALGHFSPLPNETVVAAPFEMKGPDTTDLDKIMPGRGISPVEQAWNYATAIPGAKWVLVSNCLEIRLYRFGRGRDVYEQFDLAQLDDPKQLKRFILLLDARRFLEGGTDEILAQSDSALKGVTDELYVEYSKLRQTLIGFLAESVDLPQSRRRRSSWIV